MGIIAKVKALFKIRGLVTEAQKKVETMEGTKPGWKTTEFWGKTLVQLIVICNMFWTKEHPIDPNTGLTIIGAVEALYNASRGIVKAFKK